ncbi:hypothetical protein [Cytobacillus praedii]|uniref:hypothetical protein n=1 Tax=Cytobacillus praedii TaxID=1742358 RepID=UPI002E1A9A05|nr:hypothetical protein [Cytobacillus praedii]
MRDSIVNDYKGELKQCYCGSNVTKEVTEYLLVSLEEVKNYYCDVCFEAWKDKQSLNKEDILKTKEKLISSGMNKDEVELMLKKIFNE